MLADNEFQYGGDYNRQQQQHQQRKQQHHYTTEDGTHKSQPQIITKDLTLSSIKHHENDSDDDDNENDDTDDEEAETADDIVAQTDNDESEGDQSTLHLPHARWPNHWSDDINSQLSETTPTVTYKWLTSPWSECSQKCGAIGSGLRVSNDTIFRRNKNKYHVNNTITNEIKLYCFIDSTKII